MADGEKRVAYVTVRVDTSELREKLWRLKDCLECAGKLMDELSEMELPVLADGLPRSQKEG